VATEVCEICGGTLSRGATRFCSVKCKGTASSSVHVGDVFGELTVLRIDSKAERGKNKCIKWICKCSCGTIVKLLSTHLIRKEKPTTTCGDRSIHWSGEKCNFWKGGRTVKDNGYVMIMNKKYPNAHKSGYVFEHALVMSAEIGRPPRDSETVHHKNGIRSDNRIENLELWESNHPSGQRVSGMIDFCKKYLSEHDAEYLLRGVG